MLVVSCLPRDTRLVLLLSSSSYGGQGVSTMIICIALVILILAQTPIPTTRNNPQDGVCCHCSRIRHGAQVCLPSGNCTYKLPRFNRGQDDADVIQLQTKEKGNPLLTIETVHCRRGEAYDSRYFQEGATTPKSSRRDIKIGTKTISCRCIVAH